MKSHRASYLIHKGQIPKGFFVLHRCDNPSCSNPDHLFLGNNKINMQDMARKNRTKIKTKLSQEQVNEIREFINLGLTLVKIAKKFNVSDVAIHNIKRGITWKNKI